MEESKNKQQAGGHRASQSGKPVVSPPNLGGGLPQPPPLPTSPKHKVKSHPKAKTQSGTGAGTGSRAGTAAVNGLRTGMRNLTGTSNGIGTGAETGTRTELGESAGTGGTLHHTFLTDIGEVREMEQGLLGLLGDFHSGKLQAFGSECSFESMERVREMQERLAHLHFDLDGQTEGLEEEQRRNAANQNLENLLSHLEDLSSSIALIRTFNISGQESVFLFAASRPVYLLLLCPQTLSSNSRMSLE
uniref:coiled-coil domain-containing protein 28A isoform X3 n=1 Tax=Myxine glutinosa TaxID=7769 RepID=UPI00358EA08F